jgi:branched-chain amino acid transport system permease protein
MSAMLLIEQALNGLQLGVMLFLMAAGLTLVFGVMGLINLAHGSLYMVGAFACAVVAAHTGSYLLGLAAALAAAAAAGALVEILVIRRLYDRDHLDQVLATFALILVFSEGTRYVFGSLPLYLNVPAALAGPVILPGGIAYPAFRLAIIAIGLAVAVGLFWLIARTRLGVRIRAGESDRQMIAALGVDIRRLYTIVFALGAALAGLAGALVGTLQSVEVGMGEPVLILAFVVIVIGGIGSIKGALVGAILVGVTDTMGRFLLPQIFATFMDPSRATGVGSALASMLIYILMAVVLVVAPAAACSGPRHDHGMTRERIVNADPLARAAGRAADRRADGPTLCRQPRHQGGDPGARRHRPEPRARAGRHGILRPRGLLRHRRLCGGHPDEPRHHRRPACRLACQAPTR